jgi:hypothetical protein
VSDNGSWHYSLDYLLNVGHYILKEENFIAMVLANNKYGNVSLAEILGQVHRLRKLFDHEREAEERVRETKDRAMKNGITYEHQVETDLQDLLARDS